MRNIVIFLVVWEYMLGSWPIGPFTTWQGCEDARQYQLTNGAADRIQVSPCRLAKDRYNPTSPTYGAPLTPEEHGKRIK